MDPWSRKMSNEQNIRLPGAVRYGLRLAALYALWRLLGFIVGTYRFPCIVRMGDVILPLPVHARAAAPVAATPPRAPGSSRACLL